MVAEVPQELLQLPKARLVCLHFFWVEAEAVEEEWEVQGAAQEAVVQEAGSLQELEAQEVQGVLQVQAA